MHVRSLPSQQDVKHIIAKEHELSNERIKIILAASILRYLRGRTSLSFVTDMARELSDIHANTIRGEVLEALSHVNHLKYQIQFDKISEQQISRRLKSILDTLIGEKMYEMN